MSNDKITPKGSNNKPSYKIKKLNKVLRSQTGKAIFDYNMIEDGDKIMVCMSGGKDSYVLLDILIELKAAAPINFEIVAVNLDQTLPEFPTEILSNYLEQKGVEYKIVQEDTHSIVQSKLKKGKANCSLCARLRRAILYRISGEIGATKIAMGHHKDDMLETLMLNMFFGGKLKTMPAKLKSDNGKHILIRPLAYCNEDDIAQYAKLKEYPIIPCDFCDKQPNLQRQEIKKMLKSWEVEFPGRLQSMFTAMQNVTPSHLADVSLYDFKSISDTTINVKNQ